MTSDPRGSKSLPELVRSESELVELLSRPSQSAIDALARVDGDLVVLGASGKVGPSLARMARRAFDAIGADREVIAVSRFSRKAERSALEAAGVRTITSDLLDPSSVTTLPAAGAVLYLAGVRADTSAARTWAVNAHVPGLIASRYPKTPMVAFSSGDVYPRVATTGLGANEQTPPAPIGEHATSVLGRERIFDYYSRVNGTPLTLVRLSNASELRHGIAHDIAHRIVRGESIDLTTGHVNMIWQGDANAIALASLDWATSPPRVINLTGPDRVSIRALATALGKGLDRPPTFTGQESPTALLSDARSTLAALGPPTVPLGRMTRWVAHWVARGNSSFDLPTHYDAKANG